jgi:hypothetical protein
MRQLKMQSTGDSSFRRVCFILSLNSLLNHLGQKGP